MTVKDLLDSVTFEQVSPYLSEDGEEDIESFRQHFDMLRSLEPQKGVEDVCCIGMEYDEIDCCMKVEAHPVAGEEWEKVLGMKVKIALDVKVPRAKIVARCICGTAMYGFTLEQKQRTINIIKHEIDNWRNRQKRKHRK